MNKIKWVFIDFNLDCDEDEQDNIYHELGCIFEPDEFGGYYEYFVRETDIKCRVITEPVYIDKYALPMLLGNTYEQSVEYANDYADNVFAEAREYAMECQYD